MNNKKFIKYCLKNLDFTQPDYFNEYYASVPICAINAIFSINTRFEAVLNVMERFCNYFNFEMMYEIKAKIPPINKQKSVTEVYNKVKDYDPNILSERIFQNRQRTSTSNGILKSEAVVRFLKILKDFGVEYYQNVPKLFFNETFEDCIKRIPGQRSGISLKYFFMLTGSKNLIKPDRMVLKFIKDAINLTLTPSEALSLVESTVKDLKKMGYKKMNARHLDNLIWNYQREL